jgi:hypothetical protein
MRRNGNVLVNFREVPCKESHKCVGVCWSITFNRSIKLGIFLRQMANNYNSSREKYMELTFITYGNKNKM